jgi:hypothetical protein
LSFASNFWVLGRSDDSEKKRGVTPTPDIIITMEDSSSLLSALPMCMVILDPKNLYPIASNEMFEQRMGPLRKFWNGDFIKKACSEYEA